MRGLLGSALALALTTAGSAWAQNGFVACSSQQEVEQHIQSGGELMPDGCRIVSTTVVESEDMRLCALDVGEAQDGLVGAVADAAIPSQWWADCGAIAAQLP